MVKGLYTAYTGMIIEQKKMDTLTNNMANADTNGFKKEGMTATSFADQLAYRIKDTSHYNLPKGLGDITFGAKVGETYTNWDSGSFKVTDNNDDFALDGNGFFAISYTNKQGENSIKYTRDGAFTVNTQGYLVTKDGDFVLTQAGATNGDPNQRVQIDPTMDYRVDELGNIYQNDQVVSTLGVIDFEDYNFLQKYGENLYDLVDGGTIQASNAAVLQGVLETSNVNVIDEMVEMITVTRAYEANQKLIQTIDSDLERAVTQVGRVS